MNSDRNVTQVIPEDTTYTFHTPEKLLADFECDMGRWNRENRRS
jgi:hypothetical protein